MQISAKGIENLLLKKKKLKEIKKYKSMSLYLGMG
jgi:hypothetical protein